MKLFIPWGKGTIGIDIPYENVAGVVRPKEVEIEDERSTMIRAIENPIDSQDFMNFLSDAKDVLFIVNDGTRATPTARILEIIYDKIKDKNITFLIACGTHRAPTEEEYGFIFGGLLGKFRERIHAHDARCEKDMVFLGKLTNGTEIYVNRMITKAHKIVIIGHVEPHYFAGFTGGRKAILPGIASYKTIEMNHCHATSEAAQPMVLKGNPVAEGMEEAARLLSHKSIFSIQTVLTTDRKLYAAFVGDLFTSFDMAVQTAGKLYSAPLKEKGNIVLSANPYPKDINLYQSQHALENAKLAVERQGIIILVSKCWDGIGNPCFLELLDKVESLEEITTILKQGYKLGYHKAARIMRMKDYAELWAVTDLEDEVIQSAKMIPYHDIQKAVNDAMERIESKGKEPRVVVMPGGGTTVPYLQER
ncbi:Lactate racemase [subsurface metagenome]